jgi:hypothetical protein
MPHENCNFPFPFALPRRRECAKVEGFGNGLFVEDLPLLPPSSTSLHLLRDVATLRTNGDYFAPLPELIEKLLFHEAALAIIHLGVPE